MKRKLATAALAAASALALSSCGQLTAQTGDDTTRAVNVAATEAVSATTNIDSKSELPAGSKVTVAAQDPWKVERVTVDSASGNYQDAGMSKDVWKSDPITPGETSTFTVVMRNPENGDTANFTRSVKGGPATNNFGASIYPNDGGTYGIGVLPVVTFDKEVPLENRADIQSRLKVISSPTTVEGKWRWTSSTTVSYRPKSFWPAGQKIKVQANLTNARIGSKHPSWGTKSYDESFKTSKKAMLIKISSDSHSAKVYINGDLVRTMGVSMGKSGYTTRSGIKTLEDKYRVKRMTNQGVTTDEVYDLQVPYAMRLTTSGEFLHAAPWNGNIGYANTSHGCTNLSYSDAQWVYEREVPGIPVITTGTGRKMENWNGLGAPWNIKWSKWESLDGNDNVG